MPLEIAGRIIKVLPEQNGEGKNGPWKKQDFILETSEQYPKKVCISAWGDKVEALQQFGNGEEIKVSFNVESREYNERWYTDLKVWKFEGSAAKGSRKQESNDDVTTFHAEPQGEDDLPF